MESKKSGKLPIRDVRIMLPKVITALEKCMEWMESFRASGDAGNWDWEDDEYTKAQEVLNELCRLQGNLKIGETTPIITQKYAMDLHNVSSSRREQLKCSHEPVSLDGKYSNCKHCPTILQLKP